MGELRARNSSSVTACGRLAGKSVCVCVCICTHTLSLILSPVVFLCSSLSLSHLLNSLYAHPRELYVAARRCRPQLVQRIGELRIGIDDVPNSSGVRTALFAVQGESRNVRPSPVFLFPTYVCALLPKLPPLIGSELDLHYVVAQNINVDLISEDISFNANLNGRFERKKQEREKKIGKESEGKEKRKQTLPHRSCTLRFVESQVRTRCPQSRFFPEPVQSSVSRWQSRTSFLTATPVVRRFRREKRVSPWPSRKVITRYTLRSD